MAVSPFDPVLAPRRAAARAGWFRIVPIGVCVVAGAAALFATPASPADDPELATLLRAMALVKALIVAAAALAVAWRFARPIGQRAAVGYLVGLAAMAVATALVWQLTALVAASIAFHVGLLAILVVAWRADPGISNVRRPR